MAEDCRIFIGLGSNIKPRYQNLKKGIQMLSNNHHIWVIAKSHIYQSAAIHCNNQDAFYNMVIEIETNLNPLQLLDELKSIESRAGRKINKKKNMPRTLDLDILAIGDLLIDSKLLNVPHTKISERKFVLKPWNDIAPEFIVPNFNKNIAELLHITNDKSSVRMVLIIDKEY